MMVIGLALCSIGIAYVALRALRRRRERIAFEVIRLLTLPASNPEVQAIFDRLGKR